MAWTTGEVNAAPTLRTQVSQRGDFILIGNTLGHDCAATTPAPVVGTVGACGTQTADTAIDVFWRSESPGPGQAEANTGITVAQLRSTAVLTIPPAASVTHAFLYWAADRQVAGTDPLVTLDRPGGFTSDVDAVQCYQANVLAYQCVADVTALVQANDSGPYRVSGVDAFGALANANNSGNFAGWYMIVLYALPTDPLRNLAVFDGLDLVTSTQQQNAALSGFLVPTAGFTGKLGIATFEGDSTISGDQFFFNGGAALSDAANLATNFFNSSRSFLGVPVSNLGDLPQLTGAAGSESGMDLDVVDVTAKLTGGQTSAPIQATSTGDVYYLAAFVTSISDFRPDFTTSTKSAVDLDGGVLVAGDVIEYTIHAVNTGNDAAIDVVLADALPAGVTYVPGSLTILTGPNSGAKTDVAGDDQAEYDAGADTVIFRLGTGADATSGGDLPILGFSDVSFRVTVDADAAGLIENQGVITAAGELGALPTDTPTDGNGPGDGSPPTGVIVEECQDNGDCTSPDEPLCKLAADPNVCVECLTDLDCTLLTPVCSPSTDTCVCVPTGAEQCDGFDNDCNGAADEGFDLGAACSEGLGECQDDGAIVCDGLGGATCDAVPGLPLPELCDGLDNDCDGATDEGLGLGGPCSNGVGACATDGVNVCDGQGGVLCDAIPGDPTIEFCDDIDNDCDGVTDDGCITCDEDSDCGAIDSGMVCDVVGQCVPGCRGVGGNGCPDPLVCTSKSSMIGMCVEDPADTTTGTTTDTDTDATTGTSTGTDTATDTGTDTDTDTDSTAGTMLATDTETATTDATVGTTTDATDTSSTSTGDTSTGTTGAVSVTDTATTGVTVTMSATDTETGPIVDTDNEGTGVSDSNSGPTEGSASAPTVTDSGVDSTGDDGSGSGTAASNSNSGGIDDEGFGCECRAQGQGGGGGGLMLLGLAGVGLVTRRRRR